MDTNRQNPTHYQYSFIYINKASFYVLFGELYTRVFVLQLVEKHIERKRGRGTDEKLTNQSACIKKELTRKKSTHAVIS